MLVYHTYANSSYDTAQIEDFKSYYAVVVSTMHPAKGLRMSSSFCTTHYQMGISFS